jgi:hypothetical protein
LLTDNFCIWTDRQIVSGGYLLIEDAESLHQQAVAGINELGVTIKYVREVSMASTFQSVVEACQNLNLNPTVALWLWNFSLESWSKLSPNLPVSVPK